MIGISGKIMGLVVGTLVSLAVAFLLEFLFFNLDYSRTERVQFEDDEYYYYVKAVPKTEWLEKQRQKTKKAAQKKTVQSRPMAVKSPGNQMAPISPPAQAALETHAEHRRPAPADPLEMPAVDFRNQLEETLRNIQDI